MRAVDPPKHGQLEFWESEYKGNAEFSWYCGWDDLEPFWRELVPDSDARVLLPGIGNDRAMVDMYDAGWQQLTAFDYASAGVALAASMFAERPVDLRVADACSLPYADAAYDAALEKGALDAIYLSGGSEAAARTNKLQQAVDELERCIRPGGIVLSVSAAAAPHVARAFEASGAWRVLRDGSVHITEDGFASTNVDATMFAWARNTDD